MGPSQLSSMVLPWVKLPACHDHLVGVARLGAGLGQGVAVHRAGRLDAPAKARRCTRDGVAQPPKAPAGACTASLPRLNRPDTDGT